MRQLEEILRQRLADRGDAIRRWLKWHWQFSAEEEAAALELRGGDGQARPQEPAPWSELSDESMVQGVLGQVMSILSAGCDVLMELAGDRRIESLLLQNRRKKLLGGPDDYAPGTDIGRQLLTERYLVLLTAARYAEEALGLSLLAGAPPLPAPAGGRPARAKHLLTAEAVGENELALDRWCRELEARLRDEKLWPRIRRRMVAQCDPAVSRAVLDLYRQLAPFFLVGGEKVLYDKDLIAAILRLVHERWPRAAYSADAVRGVIKRNQDSLPTYV